MIPTSHLLNSFERCQRLPYLQQRWTAPGIRPIEALYESVEAGLTANSDVPWEIAEQRLFDLATTRGIDSAQVDLLGEAEHLASLSGFIAYVLRPDGPWKRPEMVEMPDGSPWIPASFLDPTETHLRRLVLCSTWNAYTQLEQEHDWRTLEGSIYGVPMDLVVVVLGQERDGRRHGPLSKAWSHPVSKQLRFRKRDGSGFDGNWKQVWREQSDFSRESWLDSLAMDDVLPDVVKIHTVMPERCENVMQLAIRKLSAISQAREMPEESPSMCFNRVHPCGFRSACPRGLEPSSEFGFVPITSFPEVPCADHRLQP